MKIVHLDLTAAGPGASPPLLKFKALEPLLLFVLLLLIWCFAPRITQGDTPMTAMVDQGMWVLLILGLLGFLMICAISWWLLKHFWLMLGLPDIQDIAIHFNTLEVWQQLSFFLASFVSLLLAAMGCLVAIC
jgi:hypothetical protein